MEITLKNYVSSVGSDPENAYACDVCMFGLQDQHQKMLILHLYSKLQLKPSQSSKGHKHMPKVKHIVK